VNQIFSPALKATPLGWRGGMKWPELATRQHRILFFQSLAVGIEKIIRSQNKTNGREGRNTHIIQDDVEFWHNNVTLNFGRQILVGQRVGV